MRLKIAGIVIITLGLTMAPVFTLNSAPPPVESNISVGVTVPSPVAGVGGIPSLDLTAKVVIEGFAYPDAFVTIRKDGFIASTLVAEKSGKFEATLSGIPPGSHSFSIFAEDRSGRLSPEVGFSLVLVPGAVHRITNIVLPPTVEIEKNEAPRGEVVEVRGEATPGSTIFFHMEPGPSRDRFEIGKDGRWTFEIATQGLAEIAYHVSLRVKTKEGFFSEFTLPIAFRVLSPEVEIPEEEIPEEEVPEEEIRPPREEEISFIRADLNKDGGVGVLDFSILLFWWGKEVEPGTKADINGDGIMDVKDFSILMYYWSD